MNRRIRSAGSALFHRPSAWLLAVAIGMGVDSAARGDSAPTDDSLRRIEEERAEQNRAVEDFRRRAESLSRKQGKITSELARKARQIHDHEGRLTAIERRLAGLRQEMSRLRRQHHRAGEHRSQALAILEMGTRQSVFSLLWSPTADDRRRRLRMIEALIATARQTLDQQQHRWVSLGRRHREQQRAHAALRRITRQWENDRGELTAMLEEHRRHQADFENRARHARRQAQRLERRARNLRELMDTLATTGAALPGLSVPAHLPAVGDASIIDAGKGHVIEILPRSHAQVVAPDEGRVVYAGPFRSYGTVIIIDHGKGDHSVLTGLARTFVLTDQNVITAEPLGEMSPLGETPLHWEVRRDGALVDPAPWLSPMENKG